MIHLGTGLYQAASWLSSFHITRHGDGLPFLFHLSTTFYNSQTRVAFKQGTKATFTFSFHDLQFQ